MNKATRKRSRFFPGDNASSLRLTLKFAIFGVLLLALLAPIYTTPVVAQQNAAGKVTAVRPQSQIQRGKNTLDTARGSSVFWNDIIATNRGGRVRLRLSDGSRVYSKKIIT